MAGRPRRYITRPAIAERRLSLANNGHVVIALKTPYDDGTTHVVLSPMEFMGRLAALVPKPRVNLTRFHGVFSPNSKLREYVVPQKPVEEQENPKPKAYSMTWAQRLKRVFVGAAIRIEIEKCEKCGGPVRIIVDASNRSIEDPDVIQKILKHLGLDRSDWASPMIHKTAHRQQTWPTNKRRYSEFQPIDYRSVTVSIDQSLDSRDLSPNF